MLKQSCGVSLGCSSVGQRRIVFGRWCHLRSLAMSATGDHRRDPIHRSRRPTHSKCVHHAPAGILHWCRPARTTTVHR